MPKAIKFENISKQYRLGQIGTGTLSHDLNRWWCRVRGKEDPYLRIGETNDRAQKGESQYVWALRDINFEIEQGDVVGIIGRNGAGKSTLLKILSKVTKPTTGSIKYNGRIASLLEVGTGFHQEMTGRENIYMNGAIMGMSRAEITRKLDEIVDFAGVERYLDTPVKRYSSGMVVRLGFAIAAHLEPEILVVDEVLAVGDAEFQKKAIGKMQDVSKGEGRTVLFVSHNMGAVKTLCDSGVMMNHGYIDYIGTIEDTVARYLHVSRNISDENLSDRNDRLGNGLFKFTGIRFLDKNEAPVLAAFTGQSLKIELIYANAGNIDMKDIIIDVGFRAEYQDNIIHFPSDEMGVCFAENDDNKIVLEIPELLLRGGVYSIHLFATHKTTHPANHCDNIENAAYFTVISSDFWNSGKIIRDGKRAIIRGGYVS